MDLVAEVADETALDVLDYHRPEGNEQDQGAAEEPRRGDGQK